MRILPKGLIITAQLATYSSAELGVRRETQVRGVNATNIKHMFSNLKSNLPHEVVIKIMVLLRCLN